MWLCCLYMLSASRRGEVHPNFSHITHNTDCEPRNCGWEGDWQEGKKSKKSGGSSKVVSGGLSYPCFLLTNDTNDALKVFDPWKKKRRVLARTPPTLFWQTKPTHLTFSTLKQPERPHYYGVQGRLDSTPGNPTQYCRVRLRWGSQLVTTKHARWTQLGGTRAPAGPFSWTFQLATSWSSARIGIILFGNPAFSGNPCFKNNVIWEPGFQGFPNCAGAGRHLGMKQQGSFARVCSGDTF
ncbi:hypothetical protein GGX14DRAFT_391230 [Mycena pura]|uniref:Uncharacterized protein n=1 Tax=Mycena pura TaxID=153505 RepID=A0AAD6YE63_9AGAR|nr:hypothetical protein GGX14DRAFT_391230 [Mycena pura]